MSGGVRQRQRGERPKEQVQTKAQDGAARNQRAQQQTRRKRDGTEDRGRQRQGGTQESGVDGRLDDARAGGGNTRLASSTAANEAEAVG